MKKLLGYLQEKNPERAAIFKKGGVAYWSWIKEHFEDLTFWTPSDYDTENSLVISYYNGEDVAPTFLYILDGLTVTKVWSIYVILYIFTQYLLLTIIYQFINFIEKIQNKIFYFDINLKNKIIIQYNNSNNLIGITSVL